MLKEAHIQFDVVMQDHLDLAVDRLGQYGLIILPGIDRIKSRQFAQSLKGAESVILATGCSLGEDRTLLQELFGQVLMEKVEPVRGSYFNTLPRDVFQSFSEQDWVYLDKGFYRIQGAGEAILPYVSPAMSVTS